MNYVYDTGSGLGASEVLRRPEGHGVVAVDDLELEVVALLVRARRLRRRVVARAARRDELEAGVVLGGAVAARAPRTSSALKTTA